MLYRYLKELGGICAVHTSATSMGTDWRDNDPVVEPIVEIYQGDRNVLRDQEAPRAGYDPKTDKKPANDRRLVPGRASSTSRWARRATGSASRRRATTGLTHISYCIVLAEGHDREAHPGRR